MHMTLGRRGVFKLVAPIAVIAVLAAAGAYVFLTRSPSPPPPTSTTGLPTVPVETTVDQLVQDLNDRNVDGLVAFYGPNAVDIWFGNTGGLSGRYIGPEQIRLIYATSVGKTTTLEANLSDYAQDVFSPTNVNATFVLDMNGNSTVAGVLTAKVDVSEEWNWGNSGWQISEENWNYALFYSSYISAGQAPSTTFPQWGYALKGGNPNLVPEKSFEWHAGPYIAASVYAFLFGVAAFTALRLRSKGGGPGHGRRDSQSTTS
jgi:hypothetical protein